jgi:glutathione S-transferase
MESSAKLIYLQDTVDENNVFGFDNKVEQSEAVQWLTFWVASQLLQGNLSYFSRGAPENLPSELSETSLTEYGLFCFKRFQSGFSAPVLTAV